jgi:heat shock protein HtpX
MKKESVPRIKHTNFRDQIARNKRNSVLLFIFVFLVLIGVGYVILQVMRVDFFIFAIIWIVGSVSYLLISYYNSDKIALASVNAKPANPERYRQLYNSVEGLCLASGLPMPRIYIMNSPMINAFATGRDERHAAICVTTGCLEKLNKQELEGVLAHELTHIKNYDVRFVTLIAVLVGIVAIISQMFLRSLWWGGRNRERSNALLLVIGIILAILAPIIVKLVQLAISRKREFMADAGSVGITRYPRGLISALKKIKNDKPVRVNAAVAPLFFSDPLKQRMINLFNTHPPIDVRIRILEAM